VIIWKFLALAFALAVVGMIAWVKSLNESARFERWLNDIDRRERNRGIEDQIPWRWPVIK
jgi:hypothetical protein